jgi:hypothetical protein
VVEPLTKPKVAVIVEVPVATLVATPCALIVAAAGFEELQTTVEVTSCVDESLKVPVAVNCLVVPTAMPEFAGATVIPTSVAPVTFKVAVPETEPEVAVIVDVPAPTPVAMPEEAMLATFGNEADQVTLVRSCVLPSSKLPTALNCKVVPAAIVGTDGLTAIEVRCAATTVNVEVSLSVPRVAVMLVDPAATVVTTPELLTVAVAGTEEVHVTPDDKSALEPSL